MGKRPQGGKMGRPVITAGEKPTKEKILETAIDLFAENGYDRTSVRQLAHAVGLTESAVYRHYSGKDDILKEILAYAENYIFAPLPIEDAVGKEGSGSIFRGLLEPLPEMISGNPKILKISRILFIEMLHDEKVREYYQKNYIERADDYLESLFGRCADAGLIQYGDIRSLAQVFNSFRADWTFQTFLMNYNQPFDIDKIKRELEGPILLFEQLTDVNQKIR